MSAAGCILKTAVLDLRGKIRMAGTGDILQAVVVAGTGILVVDDGGNGRAAGETIHDACQKLRTVLFFAGG